MMDDIRTKDIRSFAVHCAGKIKDSRHISTNTLGSFAKDAVNRVDDHGAIPTGANPRHVWDAVENIHNLAGAGAKFDVCFILLTFDTLRVEL